MSSQTVTKDKRFITANPRGAGIFTFSSVWGQKTNHTSRTFLDSYMLAYEWVYSALLFSHLYVDKELVRNGKLQSVTEFGFLIFLTAPTQSTAGDQGGQSLLMCVPKWSLLGKENDRNISK